MTFSRLFTSSLDGRKLQSPIDPSANFPIVTRFQCQSYHGGYPPLHIRRAASELFHRPAWTSVLPLPNPFDNQPVRFNTLSSLPTPPEKRATRFSTAHPVRGRGLPRRRLADTWVYILRYRHATHKLKLELFPNFAQGFQKQIPALRNASEVLRYEKRQEPALCQQRRGHSIFALYHSPSTF